MARDQWNGYGSWSGNPADWSTGAAPGTTASAEIESGAATLTTAVSVANVLIDPNAALEFADSASLTTSAWIRNSGQLFVTGNGDRVSAAGTLDNAGQLDIGGSSLAASTSVTAAGLSNTGSLVLQGNVVSGTREQATLDITGTSPATVTGTLRVLGDADLDIATKLTAIGAGALLQVGGSLARVSVGAGTTNSGLAALALNDGLVDFEGYSTQGAGGTSITTTAGFTNLGTLWIDYFGGDGATSVAIGGALSNTGSIIIGNTDLGANAPAHASTTVTATSLTSSGFLDLQGNAATGATNAAVLDITGAGETAVTGTLQVLGDADLELKSGLTSIGYGGVFLLYGAQARVSLGAATTSTGLAGLALNNGLADFEGSTSYGGGGTSITTTTNFTNAGTLWVDYYSNNAASALTFGGTFTNLGTAIIGNIDLGGNAPAGAGATVTAKSFSSSGTLILEGNAASNATNQATLDITGAGETSVTGTLRIIGDADLELKTGLTSVGYGAFLQILGAQARISLGAAASSTGLAGLSQNDGLVDFEGNYTYYGSGGTTITTATGFTNTGTLLVDSPAGEGASSISFGGTLTNAGVAEIGNYALSASTTVTAAALNNTGALYLGGNVTANTTNEALLNVSGLVNAAVTGTLVLTGDADLAAGSQVTSIATDATLQMYGAAARISLGIGTANSALAALASNDGTFLLRGDTGYGAGATSITTTTSFTNAGQLDIDNDNGDGGTSLVIGGTLTSSGAITIGNDYLSAATTVTAAALDSTGNLVLQGTTTTSGVANQAILDITGPTDAALTGSTRVSGDADFAVGSQITSIATSASLEIDGAQAVLSAGLGTTSSALAGLASNAGTLLLRGNSGYGAGGVSITTTAGLNNTGLMLVDYYGGDSGTSLTVGGTLTSSGPLYIGNVYMGASTSVTAAALSNHGSIILQGNTTAGTTDQTTLDVTGAAGATVNGWIRAGGDVDFAVGTAITAIGTGSYLEVDGAQARISKGLGTTSSALTALATNGGTFLLRGDSGYGAGGTTITTTTNFSNTGAMLVDYYNDDGGSALSIGGTLTNDHTLVVGNTYLGAATTLTAKALSNSGSFVLQGTSASNAAVGATVDITGAFATPAGGYTRVGGDADLAVGSKITSVAGGSWLEVDGAQARISLGVGTTSSGLSDITSNYGTLWFRGDSGFGAGGTSITTTAAFTNAGNLSIDPVGGDGGSTITFGGVLTNEGALTIGNYYMTAATTVTATGLTNEGSIAIGGSNGNLAELVLNGNATSTGIMTVGSGAELDITSTHTFVQDSGTTTVAGLLVAHSIDVAGGLLDFTSALTAGDGTGILEVGPVGTLEFASSVDSSHGVSFTAATGTLALGDAASLAGAISGFANSDVIDLLGASVTSLAYSGNTTGGTLTITETGSTVATLLFKGNYTSANFNISSDGRGGTDIIDPPKSNAAVSRDALQPPRAAAFIAGTSDAATAPALNDSPAAVALSFLPEAFGADEKTAASALHVYSLAGLADPVPDTLFGLLTPHPAW